jgi:hypothetical protein
MHRSGTSALTRVLNLLGCALPDNLLGAGVGNETGHWEAASAVTLNDQIFASAGTRWDDWGPLNDDWRQSPLRDEMLHKAAAVIEEHADLGSLFAIKDPRLCRLADVWLAAMEEAKVEPSAVLMVRNPAEVIASLESRDLMAPEYGQLLWLRHALDAEFFSRGSKRVFCRYDQLLSNWFSVIDRVRIGLGVTLPRNSPSVHLEIEQYLNDKHRHHQVPIEAVISNPALSDWLRRTFAIMMNWSEEGEKSSDYAELDQTRLEFDRSYSTFARLLMPGGLTGGAGLGPSMKRELTEALQAMQDAEIASQETEARLSSAAAREAEITAEVARLEAVAAAANSDVEREVQHRQSIEAQLTDALQAMQDAEIASQETEARLSSAAAREADIMAEKAREHELRNAELLGRLAEAESAMIQRQEELAQLMAQFLEAERASVHAVVKEAIAQEQLLEAKQRIVEATDQIEAMGQRSAAERQAAEVKTDRLQTEIIQMTQILQAQQEETRFLKITRELVECALAEQKEASNEMNIKFEQQQAAMGLAEQKIRDRFTEIARLTAILADEGVKIDQATFNQEWLRSALQLAARFPKWWLLMPPKWRRKREHARYRYHGLFDAEKYLSMYPDVAEDGMDPIRHYILHGMGEGRSMTIE